MNDKNTHKKLSGKNKAVRTGTAFVAAAAVICGIATAASASTLENGSFQIVATDKDGNTAQRGMNVSGSTAPGGGTTNPGGGTTTPGGGTGGTDPGTGPGTGGPGGGGTGPTCAPDAAQEVADLEAAAERASKSPELRTAIIAAGASVNPEIASPKMRVNPLSIGDVAITVDENAAQEAACAGEDLLSTLSLSVSYYAYSEVSVSGYWVRRGSFSSTITGGLGSPEGFVVTTSLMPNSVPGGPQLLAQAANLEVKLPPLVAGEVKKALVG
jgi:hypothetical protein